MEGLAHLFSQLQRQIKEAEDIHNLLADKVDYVDGLTGKPPQDNSLAPNLWALLAELNNMVQSGQVLPPPNWKGGMGTPNPVPPATPGQGGHPASKVQNPFPAPTK